MSNTTDPGQHRYAAFISYSHSDRAVAHWLHRALEGYRPPRGVMGGADATLRPIFLDRAELPTSSDLAASVREALASSRFLIVICSPAAAKSRWVNEEIRYFKSLGGAGRVLALIVGGQTGYTPKGNAADCMPPALRYVVSGQGEVTATPAAEPMAADIRPGADERRTAMLKVAAGLLQVPLDRLVQRDNARRQRRLLQVAVGALAGCLAFALLAVLAVQSRNEAQQQRRLAEQQSRTAQRTAGFLKSLFAVSDPNEARGRTITAREVLDRGVQQIDSQLHEEPVVRADLMTTLGEVYGSLGLLREGEDLLQRAQSVPALPSGLAARQSAAIGVLQLQEGNLEAAKASLERAQGYVGQPSTADSTLYVHIKNSLGEVYWRQDDCKHARESYTDSLATSARAHLQELETWVAAQEGIAQCDMDEGNYQAADSGFQRALARQIAATGELHPRTAELLNEIGSLKYFEGDRATAGQYFERTLRIERRVLGEAHPTVTATTNNLARVLLEQRRFADARALLEPSASAFSRQVDATNPNMAFVLSNLGLIEMEQSHYPAAEAYFGDALRVAVINKHRLHGPILTDFADLECRLGKTQAGLAMLDEAQPIVSARYPDDPWRVAHVQNVRAGCLTVARRFSEAEPLVTQSMPVILRSWPAGTLYGQDALQRCLQLYRLTGNEDKLGYYRLLAESKAPARR
ncbi:MAG TPA: toll/interleukin-1 receptor domain-containing protein [Steroidobacteraceae bacterium]|nr:toll/interleukin-1 receptor domain-containing protein [Candidatus Dormibacteraeota bacterium]HYM27384.1 toll/interleukin-1 receptor domain-containing protein [Steroidobacteraceae bacterium]